MTAAASMQTGRDSARGVDKGRDGGARFVAAEIAQALGVTPQMIRQALAGVESEGCKIVRGQASKAWAVSEFPASILNKLEALRIAKRFRSIPEVLNKKVERYFPADSTGKAIPLAEIQQDEIDNARLLKKALHGALTRPEMQGAELEKLGLSDFKKAFGREVSASHWSMLHRRTIDRDGGLCEWHRQELYLSDNPKRLLIETPHRQALSMEMLESALGNIDTPAHVSIAQKDYVWLRVCDQLSELLDRGQNEKFAKREILARLQRAGCLGTEKQALQRSFQLKWKSFLTNGLKPAAILDKRAAANRKRSKPIAEQDRKIILAATVDCEGRLAQGYREAMEAGRVSQATAERFLSNPRSKSYVPHSVRREVALDAKKAVEARRRPRDMALNGAYIPRDAEGLFAGDSYCADDCTLPLYYWEPDPDSPRGVRWLRGQFIPKMCERSWLVLAFTLHSERNYNSRVIRSLITATHDDWGLPRRRFRFEQGIWKSSKILVGDEVGIEDTEQGLREFGITFSHARLARGKMAEGVLRIFQDKLERLPGYASRNEITSKNEVLARQLLEIEAGKAHPRKYLLSRDEWVTIISGLLAEYNKTAQQGKWVEDMSPIECWNANQHPEGQIHLGKEARYLLANHRLVMQVGAKGIKLRLSLGGGLYADANTGRLAGRKMLVWVNPDLLDYIALTDKERREKPIFIPRVGPIPAIDAERDDYKKAKAQIDGHNNYARTVYRSIEPLLADHNFRKLAIDRATVRVGEDMQAGVERAQVERKKKAAVAQRITTLGQEIGAKLPRDGRNDDSVARGMELLKEALEADRQSQESSNLYE